MIENMLAGTKLNPNVYKVEVEKGNKYYLLPKLLFYKTPEKIYGESLDIVERVWKKYQKSETSVSVMLTGTQGSGKTLIAELIANKAIKHNMPVIEVINTKTSIELISLMDSLENCVIILDEFGKLFNINLQEKALSMFSNINGGKKIFIITENSKDMVSRFIRNRPGRVFYSFDFDRISTRTLHEYCNDFNVTEDFIRDVERLHKKSNVFTIDFIKALVSEHIDYPHESVDDLLKVLNLDVLIKPTYLKVESVLGKDDNQEFTVIHNSSSQLEKINFLNRGYRIYLTVSKTPTPEEKAEQEAKDKEAREKGQFLPPRHMNEIRLELSNNNMVNITNEYIDCEVNDVKNNSYIVRLKLEDN